MNTGGVRKHSGRTRKPAGKAVVLILLLIFITTLLVFLSCNLYIIFRAKDRVILPDQDTAACGKADCILVLGALVRADGSLSDALSDRVETAVELYRQGLSDVILLSGDGVSENYNEPEAMKQVCLDRGIPETALVLDPQGLSTYESMERASDVYGFRSVIIVTQKYHQYRSVCFAEHVGMDATGVCCDRHVLKSRNYIREIPARVAAVFRMLFQRRENPSA